MIAQKALPPLHVILWNWKPHAAARHTYHAGHVNGMVHQCRRDYSGPFKLLVVTDCPDGIEADTYPLWPDCGAMTNASGAHMVSCYRRLRLFDPATLCDMGVQEGDRVVSVDLDTVTCGAGSLNPLWDRSEDFVGWRTPGMNGNGMLCGAMWMFRAGLYSHVWTDFAANSAAAARRSVEDRYYFGSDQAVLSRAMLGTPRDPKPWPATWDERDGIMSYRRHLYRAHSLPKGVRMVMFAGKRKPWEEVTRRRAPWIKDFYPLEIVRAHQVAA